MLASKWMLSLLMAGTHKYKTEWSSYKVSVQIKASTLFMVDENGPPVRTAPLDESWHEPSQHAIFLTTEHCFFSQQHLGVLSHSLPPFDKAWFVLKKTKSSQNRESFWHLNGVFFWQSSRPHSKVSFLPISVPELKSALTGIVNDPSWAVQRRVQ